MINGRTMSGLLALTLAAGACIGNIGGDRPSDETTSQGLCEDGSVRVPAVDMRRLTRREFNNAVRDLLGDDSGPADSFVPDENIAGFAANTVAPVTKLVVQDYLAAAEQLAARAVSENLDTLVDCDVADATCVETFARRFGRRAFRRPLDEAELANVLAVYADGKASWGSDKGFEMLLQTFLLSPQFLYVTEATGEGEKGTIAPLDGYQIAARLSFFLWQSVPDEALLDAAEAGELDSREGIAHHAERLLADERAREAVASFFEQWLEIEHLSELIKNEETYPSWSPALGEAMHAEAVDFADHVVRSGGDLETLLTASYTFADESLAELYGAPAPDAKGRIELDPTERAGLLTQASFLASRAHADEPSWVFRGKFVRESLLCDPLPPPPPGVDMNQSNDPDRLTNPECATCHVRMDPIGFGFDGYDAIGQVDLDAVVQDAELTSAGELTGPFDAPVELAHRLAESDTVRLCVAKHLFRFATRRDETKDDSCSIDAVDGQFAASGNTLGELLIAITQSDAFRFRRL